MNCGKIPNIYWPNIEPLFNDEKYVRDVSRLIELLVKTLFEYKVLLTVYITKTSNSYFRHIFILRMWLDLYYFGACYYKQCLLFWGAASHYEQWRAYFVAFLFLFFDMTLFCHQRLYFYLSYENLLFGLVFYFAYFLFNAQSRFIYISAWLRSLVLLLDSFRFNHKLWSNVCCSPQVCKIII